MCTVTYIPNKEGFHLTSNRDEHISRGQAIAPREYRGGKNTLLYPKDADKNGSWIAAKSNGDMVVLLNGAFVKHPRQAAYRRSRGLVLMDIINAEYPDQFYNTLNLYGIEPFTIVLYAAGKLYECRWDGPDTPRSPPAPPHQSRLHSLPGTRWRPLSHCCPPRR